MMQDIVVSLGGRVAEELIFDDITTRVPPRILRRQQRQHVPWLQSTVCLMQLV